MSTSTKYVYQCITNTFVVTLSKVYNHGHFNLVGHNK